MAVFYKKRIFSSMNTIKYIDDFVVWHESENEALPDVSFVPAMMRRRMTNLEKIAMGLGCQIAPQTTDYSVVFASQFGEWNQTVQLIKQFYSDKEMSPAGFSNSVHNAAAGVFSLLTKNTNSYTSIAAGENTLEMAILQALLAKNDVLVIFAGEHCPEMYDPVFNGDKRAYGLAMMIRQNGRRAVKILSGTNSADTLQMDTFAEFLSGQTQSISTEHWAMQYD